MNQNNQIIIDHHSFEDDGDVIMRDESELLMPADYNLNDQN